MLSYLTLSVTFPDKEEKLTWIFVFALLCGASKGFMKVLKAFIKPFEQPHRSVKIKIYYGLIFKDLRSLIETFTTLPIVDVSCHWSRSVALLFCWLWTCFPPFSSVFIVSFEQVNVCCGYLQVSVFLYKMSIQICVSYFTIFKSSSWT